MKKTWRDNLTATQTSIFIIFFLASDRRLKKKLVLLLLTVRQRNFVFCTDGWC